MEMNDKQSAHKQKQRNLPLAKIGLFSRKPFNFNMLFIEWLEQSTATDQQNDGQQSDTDKRWCIK